MHTSIYQKTLLHALFCLFLKSSKAFSVSLRVLGQLDAHKSKEPKIRGSEED